MELLVVVPFYFLLLGGGALVALIVMARTTLRQPPPGKTVVRWLLVFALCAAQVGCWRAADGFGQTFGGGGGTTGPLQWALMGVLTPWLVHQVWRFVRSRHRRSAPPDPQTSRSSAATSSRAPSVGWPWRPLG